MTRAGDGNPPLEIASPLGAALLGQLVRYLNEAGHVLNMISHEVDLNLNGLSSSLWNASVDALEAFRAASLLLQGATLEETWGSWPSYPHTVLARHSAAVADGAPPVTPAMPPSVIGPDAMASGRPVHLSDLAHAGHERTDTPPVARSRPAEEEQWRLAEAAAHLWMRRQAVELSDDWHGSRTGASNGPKRVRGTRNGESAVGTWRSSDERDDYIELVAIADLGLRFLRSWAALQKPQWAERSPAPGDWLFHIPMSELAKQDVLGLHLAVAIFSQIGNAITEDIVDDVSGRQEEIIDSILRHVPPRNTGDSGSAEPTAAVVVDAVHRFGNAANP